MEDEFGEFPTIYVWPRDAQGGDWKFSDIQERLTDALAAVGLDWETT